MFKHTGGKFTITALILAGAIWAIARLDFQFGIDLQGGVELTYRLDLSQVEYDVGHGLGADVVKDMISARLDAYGLKEISISVQGSERLVVQLPGAADSQAVDQIKRQIEETGQLDFMIVVENERQGRAARLLEAVGQYNAALKAYDAARKKREADPAAPLPSLPPEPPELVELRKEHQVYRKALLEWERKADPSIKEPEAPDFIVLPRATREKLRSGATRFVSEPGSYLVLRYGREGETRVSGRHLAYANIIRDRLGRPAIGFGFDAVGATQFSQVTGAHLKEKLAIVLDRRVIQTPVIQSQIGARGEITGDFTYEEVQGIVNILRGGSLPAKPELISETVVGAEFGAEAIRSGVKAVVSGLTVVLVFMLIYYMWGGFVADIALVLNIILILAYVLLFRQTLTFPGIAGILLTIGMAVDANILIFERVREEFRKGKSLIAALGTGYQRAFWVIFDSNLTTLITGIVLFQFGTGPVKGFAVTLIAGILASFFTAVFVTRLILSFMINHNLIRKFPMLTVIGVPRVDFQGYRKPFMAISAAAIAVTWIGFVIPRGLDNYGIDFTGGSRLIMKFSRAVPKSRIEKMIASLTGPDAELFADYTVQTIGAQAGGEARSFLLLARPRSVEKIASAQEPPPAGGGDAAAPAAAGGGVAGEKKQNETTTGVRAVLERLIHEQDPELLLPEPFPQVDENGRPIENPRWAKAPETVGGTPSDDAIKGVEMLINVVYVDPQLTDEKLRALLDEHLGRVLGGDPGSADPAAFKGVRVIELHKVEEVPLPGSDVGAIRTYRVRTTGFREVDPSLANQTGVPTHLQVVDAIKSFFKGNSAALREAFPLNRGKLIELSEPFPEDVFIGPQVSSSLQRQAIIAIFIAMVAIIFYLSLRFEFVFGVAAICALVHDVMISLGVIALTDTLLGDVFSLKINLPEVAAILTIIGYSVNDTIVVFDRIRENLRAGKRRIAFEDLVNASINQTLARTIWTSATTLVVVLALLIFGGEPIKGFTFAFSVGLVAGTYSSVFIASPVLIFLRRRALERQERLKAEAQRA